MKKILFLMLAVTLIFTACSKDEEEQNNEYAEVIIGKWKHINFEYSDDTEIDPCDLKGWINVISGGKYEDYDECADEITTGKWIVNGNKLTLKPDDYGWVSDLADFRILSVTETEMKLQLTVLGIVSTGTYKRITNDSENKDDNQNTTDYNRLLLGKWKLSDRKYPNWMDEKVSACDLKNYLTFKESGKVDVYKECEGYSASGSWKLKDAELELNNTGAYWDLYDMKIKEVTQTILKMELSAIGVTLVETYQKIQ